MVLNSSQSFIQQTIHFEKKEKHFNDKNFLSPSLSVPPSVDGPAEERVVETISNPVTFACDATGIPPPSLTWLKNGRLIGEVV